jgi:hypothetical protein
VLPGLGAGLISRLAGTKKSGPVGSGAGDGETGAGFSLSDVSKKVSPGATGGSSSVAGMRWSAPNPRVHPRAP